MHDAAASILTATVPEPDGLGRVVRGKDGRVARVVEHADATDEEREINEINTSIYCFRRGLLAPALRRLGPENAQGEYYLTDVIAVLRDAGHNVIALEADDPGEAIMVNDRVQLADAESELRRRINRVLDARGRDDGRSRRARTSTRRVELETDVRLLPGTILEGRTVIGTGSVIGPDCRLTDVVVGRRRRASRTPSLANARSATTARSGRSPTCARGRGWPRA